MRIPLAKQGYPFILLFLVPPFVAVVSGIRWFFVISAAFWLFIVWFFRDPEREIPPDKDAIVSPADGRIIKVERVRQGRLLNDEATKISVFMNLFSVHVNRAPCAGRVVKVLYNPGKFLSANLDKASIENEQNAVLMETPEGRILFVQIAGLVARRIVCDIKEGDMVEKGERIGMIRFGSRLDVYLPPDCEIKTALGERVVAGSSTIARWR